MVRRNWWWWGGPNSAPRGLQLWPLGRQHWEEAYFRRWTKERVLGCEMLSRRGLLFSIHFPRHVKLKSPTVSKERLLFYLVCVCTFTNMHTMCEGHGQLAGVVSFIHNVGLGDQTPVSVGWCPCLLKHSRVLWLVLVHRGWAEVCPPDPIISFSLMPFSPADKAECSLRTRDRKVANSPTERHSEESCMAKELVQTVASKTFLTQICPQLGQVVLMPQLK